MQKPPIHSLCHSCQHMVRGSSLGGTNLLGKQGWECARGFPGDLDQPAEPAQPVRSCPLYTQDEATLEIAALENMQPKPGTLRLIAHCSGNSQQVLERATSTLRGFLQGTQGRFYQLQAASNTLPKFFAKRMDHKGLPTMREWASWLESPVVDNPALEVPAHKPDSLYGWLAQMDYRKRFWRWEAAEVVHPGRLSIQIALRQKGKDMPWTLKVLMENAGAMRVEFV